jgi:hypothetical protein
VLTVLTWKWGSKFGARHVNTLRSMLARRLALAHRIVCVTDDAFGLDAAIEAIPIPARHSDTPRCRRRMRQFDREWISAIGDRILAIDLDVVLTGDITPLIDRPDPLVCWRVGYAGVFSGSIVLMDAGILDPLWRAFDADPDGYPRRAWPGGIGSDQAMLNFYLSRPSTKIRPAVWTEADGFVTFFGAGYQKLEHLGTGPNHPNLRPGARIVVLGSDDLAALEQGDRYPWVSEWR